uniref:Transposase n=1 Tax=Ascaris lumbricoides TaxID=6252 RepID=A0A0M3HK02_ASCLU
MLRNDSLWRNIVRRIQKLLTSMMRRFSMVTLCFYEAYFSVIRDIL